MTPRGKDRGAMNRRLPLSVAALLLLVAGCSSNAATTPATVTVTGQSPAVTVTVTPAVTRTVLAQPPPPQVAMKDGVYVVGPDIQPGTYRTVADVSKCYWEISKGGTNGRDIVANDNVDGGRPTVALQEGQEFRSNRCGNWTKTG